MTSPQAHKSCHPAFYPRALRKTDFPIGPPLLRRTLFEPFAHRLYLKLGAREPEEAAERYSLFPLPYKDVLS